MKRIYKTNSVEQTKPADKADSVTISSEARLVQMAREAVRKLPEVREDKVKALRQSLSTCAYGISDDQVAASMMRGRV